MLDFSFWYHQYDFNNWESLLYVQPVKLIKLPLSKYGFAVND